MKKWLGIMLLLCSSIATATQGSVLFLQTASKGKIVKNKDNSYTLTLEKLPAYVGYFSDRPARHVGILKLDAFVDLWNRKGNPNNFSKVPPNVAFVIKPVYGRAQHFVAIVSKPSYANHQLIYRLDVLGKNSIYTGDLVHLNAFFDDIPWKPGGF